MGDWTNLTNNISSGKKKNTTGVFINSDVSNFQKSPTYQSDWQQLAYGKTPNKSQETYPSRQYTDEYNKRLEQQVYSKEQELMSKGVKIKNNDKRSVLDRLFDALNVGQFAVMGGLYNATDGDKDTGVLKGIIEGLKSANPFGDDYKEYEKSFTDVLDNLGWKKENKDGNVFKPSTWTASDVARGTVGFVGDIALDPLTYLTSVLGVAKTFLKGTGTKVGKEVVEGLTQESAEKILKEITEKGGKELAGEFTEESAKKLINRVNKYAGHAVKEGTGVGIGFENFPFAKQLGIDDIQKTFISADKVKQAGDATISPLYNKITSAVKESLPVRLLNPKHNYQQLAKNNPELLAKMFLFDDLKKGMSTWLYKENQKVLEFATSIANEFTKEEQRLIADLAESSKAMKSFKTYDLFSNTDAGKEWYEKISTWRDSLEKNIADIYSNKTAIKDNYNKLKNYKELLNYLDGIVENANPEKLSNFDYFLNSKDTADIINNILYKNSNDIKSYLKKLPAYSNMPENKLDEVALTYRHIADNYLKNTPDSLVGHAQGQRTVKEVLYDVIKKSNQEISDEAINKAIDDVVDTVPKVADDFKEVATTSLKPLNQMTKEEIMNLTPEQLKELTDPLINKAVNFSKNKVEDSIDVMSDLVKIKGSGLDGKVITDWRFDGNKLHYKLEGIKGYYPAEQLEVVSKVNKPVQNSSNVVDDIMSGIRPRDIKEKLSLVDTAKKNNFNLIDLGSAKHLPQKEKVKYVNELISTNKVLAREIKDVNWKSPDYVLNEFLDNFYNNNIENIFHNRYKYNERYLDIQNLLRKEFGEFKRLSNEGKLMRTSRANEYGAMSDEQFKEFLSQFKREDFTSRKPTDVVDEIVSKNRDKWVANSDKRVVERAEYIGKDLEGIDSDLYANAREELAMTKYGKSYNNVHEVGQKKIDNELDDLLSTYGETSKVVKKSGGVEKTYNAYKYKGVNILEPVGKSANISKAEDVVKWIDKLPDEVQHFLAKSNIEVRLEDFKAGDAESVYDVGNNLITILHNNKESASALNKLRSDVVFPHEVAHAIGANLSKSHKIPNGWAEARKLDGIEWISEYSKSIGKQSEDFADSVAKYIQNPQDFISKYPNRAELIQKTLNNVPIDLDSARELAKKNFVPRTAIETIEENIASVRLEREKLLDKAMKLPSIDEVEELYEKWDTVLSNRNEFEKYMAQTFPEIYKNNTEKVKLVLDDMDIREEIKSTVKEIKKRFYEMGSLEVEKGYLDVDKYLENYVYHMLNPKYEKEVKMFRKTPDVLNDLIDPDGKFNPHNITRKFKEGYKIGEFTLKDGTKREINDIMIELFGKDDFFVEEIAPIFTARALKHNELMYDDKFQKSLLDMFGTRVKGIDKIPHGEKVVISTAELRKYINSSKSGKPYEILKSLGFAETILDNYSAPLIEITDANLKNFMPYASDLNFFSIPQVVYEYGNKVGKIQLESDTNALLKIFDRFQHLYKLNVTAVSPGFHVRNAISNYFQNWLDVGMETFNPKTQADATNILKFADGNGKTGHIITRFGKKYTYEEVLEFAQKTGVYDSGFFANDIAQRFNKSSVPFVGNALDNVNPLKDSFIPYEFGKSVGNKVENHGRLVNFISNLKLGLSPDEAGEHTIKFLFDYGDLTDFERNFMRRAIPFYTWARKNIPLQLEQIIEQPQKYAMIGKGLNAIERAVPEKDKVDRNYLNDFALDWVQLPFKTKNPEGREEPVFWNPNLPYQDITRIPNPLKPIESMKALVSDLSPAIKIPIELMANKNMFFDSPINRGVGHTEPAPGYTQPLNYIKMHQGEDVDLNRISPELKYILDQLSSLKNVGEFVEKTGSDRSVHALNYLGGIKLASYDYDKYKTWALRDRLKQLSTYK